MSLDALKALPVEELVPHAPPMVLIDRITELCEESCESEVTLRSESEFCVHGRVGAWVGIEYMAQTVAALAGAEGLSLGLGRRVGLLLGTRRYEAKAPCFEVGTTLRVRAQQVMVAEGGLAVLDCTIRAYPSNEELARAQLTTFRVDDLGAYLKGNDV